ncbi:MAG: hypothetical protein Q8P29_04020 [Candidatus Levybacteria bacterium]|nr:hypothetical protein [Candidatus Levybacteria bacterium]
MAKNPETSSNTTTPEVKKHLSKKTLVARLAVTLFIVANAGMGVKHHVDFETPNTLAGWAQDIKGIPTEWQYTIAKWLENKTINDKLNQPAPPTFDNKLPSTNVEAGINAAPISEVQLASFLSDNENPIHDDNSIPNATFLFPGRLEDGDRIAISTPHIEEGFNPLSGKIEPMDVGKDIIFSRSGTIIDAAAMLGINTNEYEVFQLEPFIQNGKSYFAGEVIRFKGQNDTVWLLYVRAPDDIRELIPMESMRNAPILDIKNERDTEAQKGKIIDKGVPTVQTGTSNAHISLNLRVYVLGQSKSLPAGINFAVDNDGKLVYKSPNQP